MVRPYTSTKTTRWNSSPFNWSIELPNSLFSGRSRVKYLSYAWGIGTTIWSVHPFNHPPPPPPPPDVPPSLSNLSICMEHDPDIWNTRGQFNKTFTSVIFKCHSLLSEFKTMTPVTANEFSTPLALRFIGVQLLQWDIFQFMKIARNYVLRKIVTSYSARQKQRTTTNTQKRNPFLITLQSRWECVPGILKLKYSRNSTNGHLFTTATLFGGQSIHWLSFEPLYNGRLSTAATFFCPKGDRCGEV